jgi:hypothetical protein
MPKYTVTIEGNGIRKIVEVDTDGMSASVVEAAPQQALFDPTSQQSQTKTSASQGGKRSAPSFRLKKRRVTRKLRKTR